MISIRRAAAIGTVMLLIGSGPATALSPQIEACLQSAADEPAANRCWAVERARLDARLGEVLRNLRPLLRSDAEREGFAQAQSAWERFRGATCAWERRAMLCCDMTEALAEDTCLVERTEARIVDIEHLIAAFGPGGPLGPAPAGAPPAAGPKPAVDGMIIPDSSERLLAPAELEPLTRAQLRLARNEIYARHGRIFDSADLQDYFARQAWYRPVAREVSLTRIERANVTLIQSVERRK